MTKRKMSIERRFDYATMTITGYRLFEGNGRYADVAREWAEHQVCSGKATYIDVGRNGPLTSSARKVELL